MKDASFYYLKNIRWVLNNSLAEATIGSSSILRPSIQKKHLEQKEIVNATIPDLEKWSEYKLKRLTEETRD
jgi:hypothetical protein